ncbi:hypothetical protein SETIT_9G134800v2 [Setaria italica]|uniref:Uncharacterized protein n=1 Tax=Setaria italica TaxID=4555 RepID=A0A368SGC5_SETIT|nr:hypothetical protein SETIT_9G134800v2 [Setaria italica]
MTLRTLHGLQPPDAKLFPERVNELNQMAEEAKRRAEIARLRELHTLKGHVESVVKLKGLDIDSPTLCDELICPEWSIYLFPAEEQLVLVVGVVFYLP